jgi:uncharacterized protein (DUF1501 family)
MPSRRVFLKNGGMALVSLGCVPEFLARTALGASPRNGVLVVVFQRGAVDGLNMVVPHGEASYYAERPTIAVQRPGRDAGAIDLDGFFGLHPRMAALTPFWRNRSLGVVHACGSHDPTRSHFDAQDYMESATPGVKSTRDGWLNRYLHAREHNDASAFRAIALTSQMPRALQGRAPVIAAARLDRLNIRGAQRSANVAAAFEAEYSEAADRVLGRAGSEAFDAVRTLNRLELTRYVPANGARYPRSAYGDSLKQIAQLIKADVGLEIAFAESGNWDHHINEGGAIGQLATRLADFADGIAALATDLGDRMSDVVILTMSEFGRSVAENGSRGTDHGHGNAMLALGGRVRGGEVYGKWPGLDRAVRWEGRDLAITTDFRDVFAEVVATHLGLVDTTAVFPGYRIEPSKRLRFVS